MSQKKLINGKSFPGVTIQDMRFFAVPHLKIYASPPHPQLKLYEMFEELEGLRNFILNLSPSARITNSKLKILGKNLSSSFNYYKRIT